jgi:hypothetical protein
MKARLLLHERLQLRDDAFVELRVWQVPRPVAGSAHSYKYALAYIVAKLCVLRYDNEAGKATIAILAVWRRLTTLQRPMHFSRIFGRTWTDGDPNEHRNTLRRHPRGC